MNPWRRVLTIHGLMFAAAIDATPMLGAALTPSPAAPAADDGWIEGKLQTMTMAEKIGQMLMVDLEDTRLTPKVLGQLARGHFGNCIFFEKNVIDAGQVQLYLRQLQDHAVTTTGVPMLVAVDQEGGRVNRLGQILGLKSTSHTARTIGRVYQFDRPRARRIVGQVTADLAGKMRDLGFNMNLAPVLDLTDDADSYIYDRSYGADPAQVADITGQYAEIMWKHGIATTGKHFPNLSVTRPDSHKELPTLDRSLRDLRRHELVPFRDLREVLGAVMVGHVLVPGVDPRFPASISVRHGDILRRTVGFKGVVISDDLKMKALTDRFSLREIVLRAVHSGVDILLAAWTTDRQVEIVDILGEAVRKGWIKPERVDDSVRRILALKRRVSSLAEAGKPLARDLTSDGSEFPE